MNNTLKYLITMLLFIFLTACSAEESKEDFIKDSTAAYKLLDSYFIGTIHFDLWDEDTISWIYDNALEIEKNPNKYSDEQIEIVNNLSSMVVNISIYNNLNYRDRELEDKIYDCRDNLNRLLDIEY